MLLDKIIKEQIDEVISFSQNIPNPKTDKLLSTWSRAKSGICDKFFNGEIMYQYPEKVQFEISDADKESKFYNFLNYIDSLLGSDVNSLHNFLRFAGVNDFYNNSLSETYIFDEREEKKIQCGTKVIKAFKYFVTSEELLQHLQNQASELIQENKIEGYLTFSVHPLDFLSSSENTYHWRSCHALDGEFRAGNLSYIGDASTVIVYLSDGKFHKLPGFPESVKWNSKKWRMLIHFDENLEFCFAGRQYPFTSPGALPLVNQIFRDFLVPEPKTYWKSKEAWTDWYNDYIGTFTRSDGTQEVISGPMYFVYNHAIFNINHAVKDAEGSKHYNDVLRSSYYTVPYYMYAKRNSTAKKPKVVIGSEPYCLCCGKYIIDSDDTMMCPDCECEYGNSESDDYRYCDHCGRRYYYTEGQYMDGSYLCDDCLESQTFMCEACGERHWNEDKLWDEKKEMFVCRCCYNNARASANALSPELENMAEAFRDAQASFNASISDFLTITPVSNTGVRIQDVEIPSLYTDIEENNSDEWLIDLPF